MALWDKIGSRGNVEDRRGISPAALGTGGVGLVGVVLFVALNLLMGGQVDMNEVLNQLQTVPTTQQTNRSEFEGQDNYEVFTSKVLGSNNDLWRNYFEKNVLQYEEPRLVLFRGATQSACGGAVSQVGPHYCPIDNTVYLDETFFDQMKQFGIQDTGYVAQSYVVAHEVGHHVQNQLGIMDSVDHQRDNRALMALELQADCLAGVWAHSVNQLGVFQTGEINQAIAAAKAVGDDNIQKRTEGHIQPENWTHGSSEDRASWFSRGYQSGQPNQCNTFNQ